MNRPQLIKIDVAALMEDVAELHDSGRLEEADQETFDYLVIVTARLAEQLEAASLKQQQVTGELATIKDYAGHLELYIDELEQAKAPE